MIAGVHNQRFKQIVIETGARIDIYSVHYGSSSDIKVNATGVNSQKKDYHNYWW